MKCLKDSSYEERNQLLKLEIQANQIIFIGLQSIKDYYKLPGGVVVVVVVVVVVETWRLGPLEKGFPNKR